MTIHTEEVRRYSLPGDVVEVTSNQCVNLVNLRVFSPLARDKRP
jgi:hypothetical protein